MLIRLIYISRSVSPLPLDLKNILATSRANNERVGITGAMCFLEGVYFQYLEGEESVIEALYELILKDKRHKDAKLLDRTQIAERQFSEWSMGLMTWNPHCSFIVEMHSQGANDDLYRIDPTAAPLIFQELKKNPNWMSI